MFVCAPDEGEAPRRAGCLCHTPAFGRLNAHLAQKFSRYSSTAATDASFGVFAAGSGSTPARASSASPTRVAFTNARLFDGKSDALLTGLRVVIDGKTIMAVEPAEAPLDGDRSGHRLRRPGSDAGAHRCALARDDGVLAGERPADRGCRLHHPGRGRRSEKDADARLHQRSRHGRANLQPEARDRPGRRARPPHLAVRRDDLANRRPWRLSLSLRSSRFAQCAAEPGGGDRRRRCRRRRRSRAPARS